MAMPAPSQKTFDTAYSFAVASGGALLMLGMTGAWSKFSFLTRSAVVASAGGGCLLMFGAMLCLLISSTRTIDRIAMGRTDRVLMWSTSVVLIAMVGALATAGLYALVFAQSL